MNEDENIDEENNKEEEPFALLNLEIEKGIVKQIKLYRNSNPEEVSFAFCKENNIDFSLMSQIKNEIESLMQNYFQSTQKENQNDNNSSQRNKNNFIKNNSNYMTNKKNDNLINDDEGNNYYQYMNLLKYNNNNENINNMNGRKLFFYQFLQEQKDQKYLNNKSNSANKYKLNAFNTLNKTKKNYKTKTHFPNNNKKIKYINDSYLTRNFNTIENNNSNIFDRLYNDAKIKRVVYKRPCHYGNHSKEKNIFQDIIDDDFETINGKIINKKTLDMNPSYSRSYQIKPNKLLSKECSFQPNSLIHNQYTNNINNSYNLNNAHISNNDNINDNHIYYNNLNFNKKKISGLYEETYIPLKNKIKYYSNLEGNNNMSIIDNTDILVNDAFNNLFNILINNDSNQIMNKNTININNIDKKTILILSPIIQDINNNEIELNSQNFINRLNIEISNDDKKYLLSNYSKLYINNVNNEGNKEKYNNVNKNVKNKKYEYNTSSHYKKNKNKEMTFFNYNKNHRLFSGTEKKKNFYYL